MAVTAVDDDIVEQELVVGVEYALGQQLLVRFNVHAVHEAGEARLLLERFLYRTLFLRPTDLPCAEAGELEHDQGAQRVRQPAP